MVQFSKQIGWVYFPQCIFAKWTQLTHLLIKLCDFIQSSWNMIGYFDTTTNKSTGYMEGLLTLISKWFAGSDLCTEFSSGLWVSFHKVDICDLKKCLFLSCHFWYFNLVLKWKKCIFYKMGKQRGPGEKGLKEIIVGFKKYGFNKYCVWLQLLPHIRWVYAAQNCFCRKSNLRRNFSYKIRKVLLLRKANISQHRIWIISYS